MLSPKISVILAGAGCGMSERRRKLKRVLEKWDFCMHKMHRGMAQPILVLERSSNTLKSGILCAESENSSYIDRCWVWNKLRLQGVKTSFGKFGFCTSRLKRVMAESLLIVETN